jgi:hypothetical protein
LQQLQQCLREFTEQARRHAAGGPEGSSASAIGLDEHVASVERGRRLRDSGNPPH